MKLKEYLYNLIADQAVEIADPVYEHCDYSGWYKCLSTFRDKTLIPKEVLEMEVVKFCGTTYYPGSFVPEDEPDYYDPYEDFYGCVMFYVEGFKEVKERLKLGEIVK